MGWIEHWGLKRDPLVEGGEPYAPLPGHEEAVARLLHAVEAGHRLAALRASGGMGKTVVLHRTLAEARDPRRRFALTTSPIDGAHLYARLAEKLGARGLATASRASAWRCFEQAIRGWALQGYQVVLGVDDCRSLIETGASQDLLRLGQIGGSTACRVTVLLILDEECDESERLHPSWALTIGLRPLTCSDAERYLTAKLASAGCDEVIFSRRAMIRLHLHSEGNPRGLDRLASLCLMAGAYKGLEAISSELVEGVFGECKASSRVCSYVPS